MREVWDGLVRDFVRHLKGTNRSESTQRIYRRAAEGLVGFLQESGQLVTPDGLTRRHIEAYMAHLIETRSASTANVVYRALQQFIKWLQDEEEIDRSPMERMRPPIVPEKPVPVLTEVQLRALLQGAKGNSFVDRRDNAILRLLLDTGGRLSEVAGLTVSDVDFDNDVVHVLGKGRRPPTAVHSHGGDRRCGGSPARRGDPARRWAVARIAAGGGRRVRRSVSRAGSDGGSHSPEG